MISLPVQFCRLHCALDHMLPTFVVQSWKIATNKVLVVGGGLPSGAQIISATYDDRMQSEVSQSCCENHGCGASEQLT